MSGQLHVDIDGAVCTLTVDHPEKRNALTPAIIASITDEFETLTERDDVRAAVLTGAGTQAFCSGYDIDSLTADGTARGTALERMMRAIRGFDYPTIARINGDVIGGGVLLAITCDLRVARSDARFGIPAAKLGVVYVPGGIELLMNTIGISATTEILLTGELFPMPRAINMDFVHRIVDSDDLDDEVTALVDTIEDNSPLSMKWTKRVLQAMLDRRGFTPGEKHWVNLLRDEAARSRDHAEAKAAFAEDRSPEFEGQ